MAFTVVNTPSVFGNKQVRFLKVTADAATQTVETGLQVIEHAAICFTSCATHAFKVSINSNASGVETQGSVGVTGVASGDEFYLTVYGR